MLPLLSIVVATTDAADALDACLAAMRAATANVAAEIVVVDSARDRTRKHSNAQGVRTISASPGTLVPELWLRGLAASRGSFVAFTIAQLVVPPDWGGRMIAGMTEGVAGAGGAIALASSTGARTWAVYFLRYSNFLAERWTPGPFPGDIAGDNAIYRRSELLTPGVCSADGFWEVDVHRRLRQKGLTFAAVAGATATLMTAHTPLRIIAERFRHGRHFGAWRAAAGRQRLRIVVAAPLVPLVLVARIARRAWRYSRYRFRFIGALPWLLIFASAWAAGELVGALAGPDDAL